MDVDMTNNSAALSTWVNGSQTVGYIETNSTGGTTTMSYCSSCSSYHWGWPHSCTIAHYVTPWVATHEHHYVQAQTPHESTIFCEGCGDMKRLKAGKKENV